MKVSKKLAGVLVGALTVTAASVAMAPSASAVTVNDTNTQQLYCWVNGISSSASSWPSGANPAVTKTIAIDGPGASYDQGESVTITTSFSQGPGNGPFNVDQRVRAIYEVIKPSGTTYVQGAQSPVYSELGNANPTAGKTLTDTIVLDEEGPWTINVRSFRFDGVATSGFPGATSFTTCNAGSTNPETTPVTTDLGGSFSVTGVPQAVVTSVTGQAAGVTAYGRTGNTINVNLTNFTAGVYKICTTPAATTCFGPPAGFPHDGDTSTIALGAGAAGTVYLVYTGAGSENVAIQFTRLGTPSISISPAAGPTGSTTALSYANFNPLASADYIQANAGGTSTNGAPVSFTTDADGTGTVAGTITKVAGTTQIIASGSAAAGTTPAAAWAGLRQSCTVTAPATSCATDQQIFVAIAAGALSQAATGTQVTLSGQTSSVTGSTATGSLNDITVTDARGGTSGWSLTGALTGPFTGAVSGATIPGANLAITPTCGIAAGATNSAAIEAAPVAGTGTAVTLCTKGTTVNATTSSTSGQYLVDAGLALAIPSFQTADTYDAILVITLA